jgi:lipoprotein-anchoring transpeptidase ErfK/SrfK
VGLSEEDAKILFDWTPVGTPIEVVADQIMEAEE